jgi:hypothetical protein
MPAIHTSIKAALFPSLSLVSCQSQHEMNNRNTYSSKPTTTNRKLTHLFQPRVFRGLQAPLFFNALALSRLICAPGLPNAVTRSPASNGCAEHRTYRHSNRQHLAMSTNQERRLRRRTIG